MDNALSTSTKQRGHHVAMPHGDMRQDSANLMRFVVEYDSMAPTVNIGDLVVVDTSITWWVKDGIYLLNFPYQSPVLPATQLLRRVIRIPFQDRYKIICDHQDYETVEVDGNLLDIAGLAVEAYSQKRL